MAEKLMVTLGHTPNVDLMYGQGDGSGYWQPPVDPQDKVLVEVGSLEEASRVVRAYIRRNGLGGGNWFGGNVYDAAGELVAHIGYNGRIWKPGDKYMSDDRTFSRPTERNPKMLGASMAGSSMFALKSEAGRAACDWHPTMPIYRLYWKNTQDLINHLSGQIRRAPAKSRNPYTRWFQWYNTGKEVVLWLVASKGAGVVPLDIMVFPIVGKHADNMEVIRWIKKQDSPMFERVADPPRSIEMLLGPIYLEWPNVNEWIKADPQTWGFAVPQQKEVMGLPGHMIGGHMDPDRAQAVKANPGEVHGSEVTIKGWIHYKIGGVIHEVTYSAELHFDENFTPDSVETSTPSMTDKEFDKNWEDIEEKCISDAYEVFKKASGVKDIQRNPRGQRKLQVGMFRKVAQLQAGYQLVDNSQDVEAVLHTIGVKDREASGLLVKFDRSGADYSEVWAFSGIPYVGKDAWLIYVQKPVRGNPDAQQVADTILAQLGGNKFLAMTGARNLVAIREGLMFALPAGARNGINKVRIVYTALDLYDVEFGKIKGTDYQKIEEYDDITFDQLQPLFTEATGLKTSL